MEFRRYIPDTDEEAVCRIWEECGWMDLLGKNKNILPSYRAFLDCSDAEVTLSGGEAECLVTTHTGTIAMLDTELSLSAVTSVAASRPVRRLGAAGQMTARAVIRAGESGEAFAALGIFDQGYYDRFGFGTFPYRHSVSLDPLNLNVPRLTRTPIRLGRKDVSRITANIRERHFHHGLVKIVHEGYLSLSIAELENSFGLGFENDAGRLTHHVWIEPRGEENGPYVVSWLVFENFSGLIELLSLLKSFGDQINMIKMDEPWGIQLQDLMIRPLRSQEISSGSSYRTGIVAIADQQIRILDMNQCLAPLKLFEGEISFNLELSDPIESFLEADSSWRGIGGDWNITMGGEGSAAGSGKKEGLPLMRASVNDFTRLIFGVVPASGLAATGNIQAPDALLSSLDQKLRLPVPSMEQGF